MGNLRIESFAGVNLLILKWLSVDIDEKYKPTAITAKFYITSLNSHFAGI